MKSKPVLVRGIEIVTERDMWDANSPYTYRAGKYYGRVRYAGQEQHTQGERC